MSSLKRKARDIATGRFLAGERDMGNLEAIRQEESKGKASPATKERRKPGRPRIRKEKVAVDSSTFEVSVTVSVGGGDVTLEMFEAMRRFLLEKTLAGKCSMERGGTAFHKHLQMVARLESRSLPAISKMIKQYLGWDTNKPAGGMLVCKKLVQKRLHTFHGMLGYCMKEVGEDHFLTVDHNVTAEDLNIGMEQYAMYGQEENKNRIALTMQNLPDRVNAWRKHNCKHPLVLDFDRDLLDMLRTGKYYPAASWVCGGYRRGYERHKMQSLYKILVYPEQTTYKDMHNVFQVDEVHKPEGRTRKEWFENRWLDTARKSGTAACPVNLVAEKDQAHFNVTRQEIVEVQSSSGSHRSAALFHRPGKEPMDENRRGNKVIRRLEPYAKHWEEGFGKDLICSENELESSSTRTAQAGDDFIPVYSKRFAGVVIR